MRASTPKRLASPVVSLGEGVHLNVVWVVLVAAGPLDPKAEGASRPSPASPQHLVVDGLRAQKTLGPDALTMEELPSSSIPPFPELVASHTLPNPASSLALCFGDI